MPRVGIPDVTARTADVLAVKSKRRSQMEEFQSEGGSTPYPHIAL
jgi:hypothetical protein